MANPQAVDAARVRDLLDKQEIAEVLYRRARAGDHGDEDAAKSCYHPGATESHALFSGLVDDFIIEVSHKSWADPTLRLMRSSVCNVTVDLAGDRAKVESHVIVFIEICDGEKSRDILNGL